MSRLYAITKFTTQHHAGGPHTGLCDTNQTNACLTCVWQAVTPHSFKIVVLYLQSSLKEALSGCAVLVATIVLAIIGEGSLGLLRCAGNAA
jgi:hypothetical protein